MTAPAPVRVIALSRRGVETALKLKEAVNAQTVYLPERLASGMGGVEGVEVFDLPVANLIGELWGETSAFLMVMAAGIAVRSIAPLARDKKSDPAVVILDPEGCFAVPILSGHLGGGNELAREVADKLGGTAVITTATDCAGRPAAEVWARDESLSVENFDKVVTVNSAWADGDPVGLWIDPQLPQGCREIARSLVDHVELLTCSAEELAAYEGALVAVTHRIITGLDGKALLLRPSVLAIGAGCRKDADPQKVEEGVLNAIEEAGYSSICANVLASVDAKANEPALLQLARTLGVDFITYTSGELKDIGVPNPSGRVAEAVGTPSVCEAAALKASNGGKLLLEKVSKDIWTLSIALCEWKGSGN